MSEAWLTRRDGTAPPVFHPVPPPDMADLQALVQRIAERLGGTSWAQRLRRVFAIEIERCVRCEGLLL